VSATALLIRGLSIGMRYVVVLVLALVRSSASAVSRHPRGLGTVARSPQIDQRPRPQLPGERGHPGAADFTVCPDLEPLSKRLPPSDGMVLGW
jgi:hypothetical protein